MKLNKNWVIVGIVALFVTFGISNYYDARDFGAKNEQLLKATKKDNENILSSYSLKVQEVAQVPDMYKEDLKEVVTTSLSARYGAGGSKATFQWLKEHDINIDSAMYIQIQQVIEAGRSKFENAQTVLLDQKRGYATVLENDALFTRGWWLKQVGYPRINLDDYNIVSNDYAAEAFKTGKQNVIKLR